ncbi:MAG: S1 family peptidase [Deltaproteobacteria bacterium]|nr:S1 family peptidase [Deltaproteobacteria bacterium]
MIRSALLTIIIAALTSSCALRRGSSKPKVTNGKRTTQYPAVVEIRNGTSRCTGTFIRPNTLITAAHCVSNRELPIFVPALNVASNNVVVHPDYTGGPAMPPHDLAFVFFPDDVGDQTLSIKLDPAAEGDPVQLIGFGDNQYFEGTDSAGSGIKRIGTNQIEKVENGAIALLGQTGANATDATSPDGTRSALGSGDSGGPLLSKKGDVIGIAAFVKRESANDVRSYYTSLASETAFIESTLANNVTVEPASFLKKCRDSIKSPSVKTIMQRSGDDGSCDTAYAYLATITTLTLSPDDTVAREFDLSLIADITWLTNIQADGVKLSNFDAIGGITKLERVTLKNTGVTNLSPLAHSYSLIAVTVDESNDLPTNSLDDLPNLAAITVNGKSISTKNFMRERILGGTWARECHRPVDSSIDQFLREVIMYDPQISSIEYVGHLYSEAGCTKKPSLTIKNNYLVSKLIPNAADKTFSLDIAPQLSRRSLTVYDDSWMPSKMRDAIRSECRYEIGKPTTSCEFYGSLYPFTTIRRDGKQLLIGISAENGKPDGKSAAERYTRIDPNQVLQISDTPNYSYFNNF